jgi:hypothetical protein
VGGLTCVATLLCNATAQSIWDALPLEGRASRWGDEIYFAIPVNLDEDNAQAEVQVGDLAYWPPGHALCIFWGPTPASQAEEPRAPPGGAAAADLAIAIASYARERSGATRERP